MMQEMMGSGMQWHQLDHMLTTCTSLQTDNHPNRTPRRSKLFTDQMLFLMLNQQCSLIPWFLRHCLKAEQPGILQPFRPYSQLPLSYHETFDRLKL